MSRLNKDSNIVIDGTSFLMKDLVSDLANLPSEDFSKFLKNIGLTVPKKLKIAVLKKVLKDPVDKTIAERANLADELGYRLSWFLRYSEFQLESLLKFYNSKSLNKHYLETLWLELFNYMMDKKVSDKDLSVLVKLSKSYDSMSDEDVLSYNLALKESFYDEVGEIDGLTQNDFRPVLYKSSTLVELRELGKKYDVDVPRRLKKEQLADIIISELKEKEAVTEEREAEIRKMSIVVMQRFAKDNNIKASIELKKEEIIEYILANATQTKEMYFLPADKTIYMQEITEPEPVIEEPVIKEEPVVEESSVPEVEVVEDYTEVLEEVRYLRGLLHDHVATCDAFNEEVPKIVPEEEPAVIIEEETPEIKEPIVLNTASFYSDKKHAKQDYQDLVASMREVPVDRPAEEPLPYGSSAPTTADQVFTTVSWIVAVLLLGVVIFLLINYLQGGIF